MKCCHLVAALVLVGCGLNSEALPGTGRGADAGVDSSDLGGRATIAGSPASWPSRRRLTPLDKDGGTNDTKDPASKPPAGGQPGGQQPSGQPNQGGAQANPAGSSNPGGQAQPSGQKPNNGGKGSQAKPAAQDGGGTSQPSSGNTGSSTQGSQSNVDAGAGSSHSDAGSGNAPNQSGGSTNGGSNNGGSNNGGSSNGGSNNGGQSPSSGPGSNGNPQMSGGAQGDGTLGAIVDLVIAILDLSLGPIRPVEIEQLVASILVLSLSPVELAADSLIAVLDALDDTRICSDHPERCNPLCTNLESDCSVCGRDEDCIERIEEMCQVQLPKRCH